MNNELRQALELVARRYRRVRLWSTLALCWLAWSAIGLGLSLLVSRAGEQPIPTNILLAGFLSLASTTAILCAVFALRTARDPRWVARRIEALHPELGTGLLAAVEQTRSTATEPLGFLQSAVIREALDHRRAHNWERIVSPWRLRSARFFHLLTLLLLIVVSAGLFGETRTHANARSAAASAVNKADVQVEPGNTEIERGSPLLVVARFNSAIPPEAHLVVEDSARATARRSMIRSLEDPTFAGRVEAVDGDLAYHVEFRGQSTDTFKVHVFEYPELLRTDAQLVFPAYTTLKPKTVEDVRHVTAVEGTELTLFCRLNKEVAAARLVDPSGQAIDLKPHEESSHTYRATLVLTDSKRYRVQLVDRDRRANKLPAEIVVNVTRNHPAVVKMLQPARDMRVSPVEELSLKAQLDDDFGVVAHGLSYSLGGEEPKDLVLNPAAPSSHRVTASHLLDFEALKAAPDQLVTYFFWADDIGPDGKPRRTSGDMFFAEVRHFEEIFRQGEQPPSGSSQNEQEQQQGENAQQSDKLAELQKEIINATWKLIRREIGSKPSAPFAEDVKTLQESQASAVEQAGELAERLRDPVSKANLDQATRHMKEADKRLAETSKSASIPSLRPALVAEQAAYQALLKLRAREFEVTRSNSRQRNQSGRAGGSASSAQLQQLELSNDENRYEQQRSARAQNEQQTQREREDREVRQVLNRLRELSQRQNDLNDRMKELQSALQAAQTPTDREEIERQLKRLRDQQQQVLRDTDELRERMEREENRERMAEAREQIEQGREHVRQASEALEQGRLPQALTEGARAGRQLNDLREQLRKNASNRFAEDLSQMRGQARQLDENQKQLTEQLENSNRRSQQELRDRGEREQAKKGLEQQRTQLDQLVDRMRNTVQEAEETEPLLAKNLFDTVQKASEKKIPEELNLAEQLAGAGFAEDATKLSRHAGQGLEQLRQGVERAAESVLGDETSALKRAQGELDELGKQLDREIAQSTGEDPNRPRDGRGARPGEEPGNNERRQPGARGANGEGEPGAEQPDGQRQPGEPGDQNPQGKEQAKGQRGQGQAQRKGQGAQGKEQAKGQRGQGQGQGEEGQDAQGEEQAKGQQGQGQGEGQDAQGKEQAKGQRGQGKAQGKGQRGQGQGQGQSQDAQGKEQAKGQRGQGQGQGGEGGGEEGAPGDPENAAPKNQPGGGQQPRQAGGGGQGGRGNNAPSGIDRMLDGLANSGPGGPVTGEGFRQWSDRMRDVEELLDNPDLRAEAARIRDRVRGAREEFKRHAKVPDWNQMKTLVADPLQELRSRIAEEVRRRESPDALVPIDRDPVPPQYAEAVRRYYERLGSGR